jgi:hypothetical protein
MSLEKQKIVDRVEVLETGHVQVRTAARIVENGIVIAQSFHRHVVAPGDDYSAEDARVQAICATTHTPEAIAAFQAAQAAAAERV